MLYHVLAETDYYEPEPAACLELLDEFRLTNDPVRQFLDDPFSYGRHGKFCRGQFVFDLYHHWFCATTRAGDARVKSLIEDLGDGTIYVSARALTKKHQ